MTLNSLPAIVNQVLITPGALAILDQCSDDARTCLAVTRAIEGTSLGSHDEARTRMIAGSRLAVRFIPERGVALINVSTRFEVA